MPSGVPGPDSPRQPISQTQGQEAPPHHDGVPAAVLRQPAVLS